jgi:hypothetical protein
LQPTTSGGKPGVARFPRNASDQKKIAMVNICAITAIVIGQTMTNSSRSRMATPSRYYGKRDPTFRAAHALERDADQTVTW